MDFNRKLAAIPSNELILQIERLALNTWPAALVKTSGPWLYRASGGITKRANSVWTAAGSSFPGGDWLKEAGQFYRLQGLPVRYHISDGSPIELDGMLAAHGFEKEVPCTVMIAEAEQVITNTAPLIRHPFQLTVSPQHDGRWLNNFVQMEGFGEDRLTFYNKLFADIVPLKGFFTLELEGGCAAVGTSVIEEGWAGFINVAVNPALRGRGIGRILIHELASWSRNHGAHGLYLQVINDNEPAIKLYSKAGYTPLYQYHYRVKNI